MSKFSVKYKQTDFLPDGSVARERVYKRTVEADNAMEAERQTRSDVLSKWVENAVMVEILETLIFDGEKWLQLDRPEYTSIPFIRQG